MNPNRWCPGCDRPVRFWHEYVVAVDRVAKRRRQWHKTCWWKGWQ